MNSMQPQHPYKITPDQAWDKMKVILDEKMPEHPSSRRYPFVWWSVSTVVIAALMGVLVFKENPSTRQNEQLPDHLKDSPAVREVIQQKPSTRQVQNTEVNISTTPSEEPVVSPDNTHSQSLPPAAKQKKEDVNATPVLKSSSKSDQVTSSGNTIPMAMVTEPVVTEPALEGPTASEDAPAVAIGEDYINEEELYTGIVEVREERYRDARITNPLSVDNVISGIPTEMNEEIITSKSIKNKVKTPFIEPNIAMSGMAGLNGGLGLYGGAGVNLNVSGRFSITTSAGYLSYNPNSFLSGYLDALDGNAEYNSIVNYNPSIIGNETYVDAGNINNKARYNAINPLIDRVSQWQIAAGLKWKITPRFFSEIGVQVGLHTQAYSEYPIVSFDQVGSTTPSLRIDKSFDDYDVIRSSTTSLYLGVGYRIGQHIDVFSNWNHGLHQYILTDENNAAAESGVEERTDYIRGLSLGLRYTL
jgi:hypothetical protein